MKVILLVNYLYSKIFTFCLSNSPLHTSIGAAVAPPVAIDVVTAGTVTTLSGILGFALCFYFFLFDEKAGFTGTDTTLAVGR